MSPTASSLADDLLVEFDEERHEFYCCVTRRHLERWHRPPLHLLADSLRVRKDVAEKQLRMRQATLDLSRLNAIWNAFRTGHEDVVQVRVVLGESFPPLPGFYVDIEADEPRYVFVTLPENADVVRSWNPLWLEASVNRRLAGAGRQGAANAAQLRIMHARVAYFGEHVKRTRLLVERRTNPLRFDRPYQLLVEPQRGEVELLLGQPRALSSSNAQDQLHGELVDLLWGMARANKRSSIAYHFREDLARWLHEAMQQPTVLGLGLPLVLPAAFFLLEELQPPWLDDPQTMARLDQIRREPQVGVTGPVDHLLLRRGAATLTEANRLVANERTQAYSLVNLVLAPADIRERYLAEGRRGRADLQANERDLQALTIPLAAEAVEGYIVRVERFARDLAAELSAFEERGDRRLISLCQCFPLTLPYAARKAAADVVSSQVHDEASWLMLVVRELVGLTTAPGDPVGLATMLVPPVSAEAVKKALAMLVGGKLIQFDEVEQRYKLTSKNIMTGDNKGGDRMRRAHEEIADLGAALLGQRGAQGTWFASTVAIDTAHFEIAKKRLLAFFRGMFEEAADSTRADVILQVHVQMFLK